jgi:hypothetical protein
LYVTLFAFGAFVLFLRRACLACYALVFWRLIASKKANFGAVKICLFAQKKEQKLKVQYQHPLRSKREQKNRKICLKMANSMLK